MKNTITTLSLTTIISIPALYSQEVKKPNFVFFIAEDLIKDCFELYNGSGGALTPFLTEMSKQGVIFENAYCSAPVSSAARSTLITGIYAPSLGLSSHRKLNEIALPEGVNMFPTYLRNAGYHTSNASKTDYNCILDEKAWSKIRGKMGDWRKRGDTETPFFHCASIADCHESSLHFSEDSLGTVPTQHNPIDIKLYPHHPDTELFRHTYATLYDRISRVDATLGKLLKMLEEDDLLEDTFVFYFGDNGGCLPFSKGYTNEKGLNIPLVVYVPENWKDKVPFDIGGRTDSFVSFLDFGATLLNLAEIEIPKHIDGKAFMGNGIDKTEVESRDLVFGYGDRYDELYV